MKRLLTIAVCGAMLAGCGGGGTKGSKLSKNDYLGTLPALYDAYNTQKAEAEKSLETESTKLMEGGEKNYDKVQKMFDDAMSAEKERETKFKADVAAELPTLAGKNVPVTYSEGLTPFYAAAATIGEGKNEPVVLITLTAKDALTVPSMKGLDYAAYFCLVDAAGTPLERSASVILPIKLAQTETAFTAGQELVKDYSFGFNLGNYAASRVGFAGLKFITQEEYNAQQQ